MEDARLDDAFAGLAKFRPRIPTKLLNEMVYTVNKLDAERERRMGAAKPELKPQMKKQAAQKQHLPERKPPGMKM